MGIAGLPPKPKGGEGTPHSYIPEVNIQFGPPTEFSAKTSFEAGKKRCSAWLSLPFPVVYAPKSYPFTPKWGWVPCLTISLTKCYRHEIRLRRIIGENRGADIINAEGGKGVNKVDKPGSRRYNHRSGRPGLNVNFKAVCDTVQGAWNGSGESITDIAESFGVSRGWIHKWVYPELRQEGPSQSKTN